MEHGNSKPVKSGELAVTDAYITVDFFINTKMYYQRIQHLVITLQSHTRKL